MADMEFFDFSTPLTEWENHFAWLPVETAFDGWVWLRRVERRMLGHFVFVSKQPGFRWEYRLKVKEPARFEVHWPWWSRYVLTPAVSFLIKPLLKLGLIDAKQGESMLGWAIRFRTTGA